MIVVLVIVENIFGGVDVILIISVICNDIVNSHGNINEKSLGDGGGASWGHQLPRQRPCETALPEHLR